MVLLVLRCLLLLPYHCNAKLFSVLIPSPEVGKPLFALNHVHGSMLAQIVQIAIWKLHVKDHCLRLFWVSFQRIPSLGISFAFLQRGKAVYPPTMPSFRYMQRLMDR
jgi:hypothetical protein